jgi:hypothetical protein
MGVVRMENSPALLILCLRAEPKEVKVARLRELTDNDWVDILMEAKSQGIAAILFHILKPLQSAVDIPRQIHDVLRQSYLNSLARNMRLFQKLLQLLTIFNKENIPVILLKGAHLAKLVYESPALRPMSDIDLLAKEDDLLKIHDLLIENGFSTLEQDQGPVLRHMAPYRKKNFPALEIHYNIGILPDNKLFETADLWERAHQSTLEGVNIITLCPEDLLLHLCAHTSIQHSFSNGLTPYFDIRQTVEKYNRILNWEILSNRAIEWGLERSVDLMLLLTDKFIGLPLPEQFSYIKKPDQDLGDALITAEELIFQRGPGVKPSIARLFGKQGWRVKLKYLMQSVLPSKQIMTIGKKKTDMSRFKLFRLYYLHLKNLYRKYWKIIWLGLRRNPKAVAALENQKKRNELRDWLTREVKS